MEDADIRRQRLLHLVARANDYCVTVENALTFEKDDFIIRMLADLPALYMEFNDIEPLRIDDVYLSSYMDEEYYDTVRSGMERLFGSDDVFLETFVEDMKYSDTPIGVSIAESLADIFQDLYNFVAAVKESDAEQLEGSYDLCHEAFEDYWSQKLCNVLRPLNHLRYHSDND